MKKIAICALIASTAAGAVWAAANDSITARQSAMKAIAAAAKARDFTAMNTAAVAAKAAFAENTAGQGSIKTEALDTIWTNMADFDAIMTQMVSLSGDANPAVFETCKSCHKTYRVAK